MALAVLTIAVLAANESQCRGVGFNDDVPCSGCVKLGRFVKDDELLRICNECCFQDKATEIYQKATLKVNLGGLSWKQHSMYM